MLHTTLVTQQHSSTSTYHLNIGEDPTATKLELILVEDAFVAPWLIIKYLVQVKLSIVPQLLKFSNKRHLQDHFVGVHVDDRITKEGVLINN